MLSVSWEAEGAAAYAMVLDETADTIPGTDADTARTEAGLELPGDGIWWLHVRGVGEDGTWGATAHRPFRIDTTPPAAPVLSSTTHPDETTWTSDDDPLIDWTVPADLSGVAGYSIVRDSSPTTVPDKTVDTTSRSRRFWNAPAGQQWIHVRAVDGAGRWGPADHYQVKIDDAGPSTPEILTSSHEVNSASADPQIDVWWAAASDPQSGIAGYQWKFTQSRQIEELWTGFTEAGPYASFAQSDVLSAGEWYFHVRAVDALGRASLTRSHGPFLIGAGDDAVGPRAPTVESTSHPDQDVWERSPHISLKWKVVILEAATASSQSESQSADQDADIEAYSYVLDQSPTTVPDTEPEDTGASGSTTFFNQPDGGWWFHVRAQGPLGLWSKTTHYRIRIDRSEPITPDIDSATHPSADDWNRDPIAASWSFDNEAPIDSYAVVVDQQPDTDPGTTATQDDSHGWLRRGAGPWYLHLRAIDAAGNISDPVHRRFLVDDGAIGPAGPPQDGDTIFGATGLNATAPPGTETVAFEVSPTGSSTWTDVATATGADAEGIWAAPWQTDSGDGTGQPLHPDGDYDIRTTFTHDGVELPALTRSIPVTVNNALSAVDRVRVAYQQDTLTVDEFAEYGVYAVVNRSRLPARYDGGQSDNPDGSGLLTMFLRDWKQLDESTRQTIVDFLSYTEDDPTLTTQSLTSTASSGPGCGSATTRSAWVGGFLWECQVTSGAFRILYNPDDGSGPGVDATEDNIDGSLNSVAGGNGIPDYIDRVQFGLHRGWDKYTSLGWKQPDDSDGLIDVMVGDSDLLGIGADTGFAPPELRVDLLATDITHGLIFLDDDERTEPGDLPRPFHLAMHELMHRFQYEHITWSDVISSELGLGELWKYSLLGFDPAFGNDLWWWSEATAEWGTRKGWEHIAGLSGMDTDGDGIPDKDTLEDDVPLYADELDAFLGQPEVELNRFDRFGCCRQYGAFVFASHLEHELDPDVIKLSWERIGDGHPFEATLSRPVHDAIRQAIEAHGGNRDDILKSFGHRAYLLDYPDSHVDPIWRDILFGDDRTDHVGGNEPDSTPRAASTIVELTNHPRFFISRVHRGGSQYHDLVFDEPGIIRMNFNGNPDLTPVSVIPFQDYPVTTCGVPGNVYEPTWTDGSGTLESHVDEDCDFATVVVTGAKWLHGGHSDTRDVYEMDWTVEFIPDYGTFERNGITLGLHQTGRLLAPTDTPSAEIGSDLLGLRQLQTDGSQEEGIANTASPCEGWGLRGGWIETTWTGSSSCYTSTQLALGSTEYVHYRLVDFNKDETGLTAESTVEMQGNDGQIRALITHELSPAVELGAGNFFKLDVTVRNTGTSKLEPYYRRVIDWDVEGAGTAGAEYITIDYPNSAISDPPETVAYSSTEGLEPPHPANVPFDTHTEGHECGFFQTHGGSTDPDVGSLLDLWMGDLQPSEQARMRLYLGVVDSTTEASTAVGPTVIGADAWVFASPGTFSGLVSGEPNTFVLAYLAPSSVTGSPVLTNCGSGSSAQTTQRAPGHVDWSPLVQQISELQGSAAGGDGTGLIP